MSDLQILFRTKTRLYRRGEEPTLIEATFEHNVFGEMECWNLAEVMPNIISIEKDGPGRVVIKAYGELEETTDERDFPVF